METQKTPNRQSDPEKKGQKQKCYTPYIQIIQSVNLNSTVWAEKQTHRLYGFYLGKMRETSRLYLKPTSVKPCLCILSYIISTLSYVYL